MNTVSNISPLLRSLLPDLIAVGRGSSRYTALVRLSRNQSVQFPNTKIVRPIVDHRVADMDVCFDLSSFSSRLRRVCYSPVTRRNLGGLCFAWLYEDRPAAGRKVTQGEGAWGIEPTKVETNTRVSEAGVEGKRCMPTAAPGQQWYVLHQRLLLLLSGMGRRRRLR